MPNHLRGAAAAVGIIAASAAPAFAKWLESPSVEQVRVDIGERVTLHLPHGRRITIELRSGMSLDGGYRSAACDVVISGVAGNETETTEASIPFLGQWRDTASHMPMTATCGEEDDNLALFVDARGSGAVPDERKVTGLGASVSDGARK